jgi:hypothetical protein
MHVRNKRRLIIAVAIVAVYFGVYAFLSHGGGYILTQSGEVRYAFGLSVSDVSRWEPRFAYCEAFRDIHGRRALRANFLGYVFAPLILADQVFLHPTIHLIDPETGKATDITGNR